MKVTQRIGRALKPFVNFPRWMSLNGILSNARNIVKMVTDLRIHRPSIRKETFEEALVRLNLSEEDIQKRMKNCLILSIIYFIATLIFLTYTVYMILHFHLGAILGLLITILMAAFTYREHFWYFQLKTRKLGNKFSDWVAFILRGTRK